MIGCELSPTNGGICEFVLVRAGDKIDVDFTGGIRETFQELMASL